MRSLSAVPILSPFLSKVRSFEPLVLPVLNQYVSFSTDLAADLEFAAILKDMYEHRTLGAKKGDV